MSGPAAGFREGVRFVRDAGFVYLDDGRASFRIGEAAFDALLLACRTEEREKVVARYPTLFRLYDAASDAEESIVKARFV
ncbi:hypothetical protein WMF30_01110 [Sorangium sp. So ce134]